jgi:hypothetical protein
VRAKLAGCELRVDQTAYTILALITGLRAAASIGSDPKIRPAYTSLRETGTIKGADASELLTDRDAVCLLLDVGLLNHERIVEGKLDVYRAWRRNHNFLVQSSDGSGFLIKQASTPSKTLLKTKFLLNSAPSFSLLPRAKISEGEGNFGAT